MGASFVDEIDCGSFFDQIDDLLDFPTEDLDVGGLTTIATTDTNRDFPAIWSSTDAESFPCSDSVFSGNNTNSDLSTELSVPYEDIVQLEWLSNFVEDSFSSRSLTLTINKQDSVFKNDDFISTTPSQFLSSSPVSVLDDNGSSSSSSSGEKTAAHCPEALVIGKCGRARSKRPRPTSFSPRPGIQLISPSPMTASSITDTIQDVFIPCNFSSSDSENYAESRPPPVKEVVSEHKKTKKKKIKFSFPREMNYQNSNSSQGVRKCLHCEVTKTPQWRAGPLGPKTLCNACGVRFKSGRLFPEYRPAASPTFVPCLHSNSHKKVIEMRTRGDIWATNSSTESPELIPNTNSGISMEFA